MSPTTPLPITIEGGPAGAKCRIWIDGEEVSKYVKRVETTCDVNEIVTVIVTYSNVMLTDRRVQPEEEAVPDPDYPAKPGRVARKITDDTPQPKEHA